MPTTTSTTEVKSGASIRAREPQRHARFASTLLAIAIASVAVTGCNGPPKEQSKATVEPVAPTTRQASAATPPPRSTVSASARPVWLGTATYAVDQRASKIAWVGTKVTGKHEGAFGTFEGTVDVVDGFPEKGRVDVQIDAGSITSDSEKLTSHLKSPDFFDVKTHPKASFVSTEIKKDGAKDATYKITGNLTIKGVTKSLTFPATLTLAGDAASVDAEFSINRRDFSLNYAGMPNALIQDDVLIKLAIRAKKTS